jgi:ABC-type Fe3+/spermidine/putrescine transport system ATPase subunit
MILQVSHVAKSYGETRAVQDVSFTVAAGEIMAVLGPSGCGKSTLLEMIAGLVSPDRGDIRWDGNSMLDVPTYRRNFGLMFQDFALFPHRNVFDNVAFGMQMAHMPLDAIRFRVNEVLDLVGLPGFGVRDVNTLSGGEQQRVALARSLAPQPRLLMLDEPLGSLDRNLRERLVKDLRQILWKLHLTTIYVTHDQEESFAIADRIVVMNAGKVEQIAPPQEIYCSPASLFVARFIGLNNLFPAQAYPEKDRTRLESGLGSFELGNAACRGPVTLLVRPDAVFLTGEHPVELAGELIEKVFRGSTIRTTIEINSLRLIFDFPNHASLPAVGETIQVKFDPEQALKVFPDREL